jgi:flagellar assembly protein FliH
MPDLARPQAQQAPAQERYQGGFLPLVLEESQEDPREKAERQAAAMLEEAQAQAQAIGEQARQEGYQAGYQAGQEDGLAAGQARVEAACDNLARALKVLQVAKASILEVMEGEMVALVQAACDRILLAPEAVDPALVRRVVREAILRAGEAERMVVTLHPDDLDLVRQFRPRLLEEISGLTRLDLRPDPSLRPGDCRVDSPTSHVDATLESRRQRIFDLLAEPLHQGQRPDLAGILDRALQGQDAPPPKPVSDASPASPAPAAQGEDR